MSLFVDLSFSLFLSHFIYRRLPFVLLTLSLRSRAREQPGYSPTHARDDDDDDAGNAGCCNMQTPNGRCFSVCGRYSYLECKNARLNPFAAYRRVFLN